MSHLQRANGPVPGSIHSTIHPHNVHAGSGHSDEEQAHAFLQQHGRHLHPAFDAETASTANHAKAETHPSAHVFKDTLDIHTKEFIAAVESYKDGWQDPRIRALSLHQKTSWEQVIQEIREAEVRYAVAGQTGIRKIVRKASSFSLATMPYLRMIPDNSMWLPAVGGALKLIFEVTVPIFSYLCMTDLL